MNGEAINENRFAGKMDAPKQVALFEMLCVCDGVLHIAYTMNVEHIFIYATEHLYILIN